MSSNQSSPLPDAILHEQDGVDNEEGDDGETAIPTNPPGDAGKGNRRISLFWHDRLIEASLIVSMAFYYVIGNYNLGSGAIFHVNPLLSLPFLGVFAVLCWYRLSFAIALLPLALPFYLIEKPVYDHYVFSPIEISLGVCVLVFVLQLVWKRTQWNYWLTWRELRDCFGPFSIPIVVFLAMAAFSIVIAYNQAFARLAFRREVLDPLLYVVIAFYCLRTRRDLMRLLGALFATGFMVASVGMVQYLFFKHTLVLESDGIRRVHAMYGSANSIGLLFDYTLPLGIALLVAQVPYVNKVVSSWKARLGVFILCLPMLYVLYLTQSIGAWLAIPVAVLFIVALSIRNRKVLWGGTVVLVVGAALSLLLFHTKIETFLLGNHLDAHHVSTATKRYYLWLTALHMIHDSPWFGYGMDNWLCHYSYNTICVTPHLRNYLIAVDPVTHLSTDLKFEPNLSHPHNIFLHVWVSMGIFGLIAFIVVLILFYWLLIRVLRYLRSHETKRNVRLQWMTVGIGGAMLAALVQGMIDSSFLEQDLAFCFWMLVVALLLLRAIAGTPWRGRIQKQGVQQNNGPVIVPE